MNRLLFLLLLGAATFLIVVYLSRPDLIKDFWLWCVGLAGPVLKASQGIINKVKSLLSPAPSTEESYIKNKTLKTNEQG